MVFNGGLPPLDPDAVLKRLTFFIYMVAEIFEFSDFTLLFYIMHELHI